MSGSALQEVYSTHLERQAVMRSRVSVSNRCWGRLTQIMLSRGADFADAKKTANAELPKVLSGKCSDETIMKATRPWVIAFEQFVEEEKPLAKTLEHLGSQLPHADWVRSVRGFGMLNYASIIAETGDLRNYANPAKVWKRLGLGVMPDGNRQRKVQGEEAKEHGFSPRRRKTAWLLGESLVKKNDGPYREAYLRYKEYQKDKNPGMSPGAINNRAKRYMVKMVIRDLWRVWNSDRDRFRSDIHE